MNEQEGKGTATEMNGDLGCRSGIIVNERDLIMFFQF